MLERTAPSSSRIPFRQDIDTNQSARPAFRVLRLILRHAILKMKLRPICGHAALNKAAACSCGQSYPAILRVGKDIGADYER